MAKIANKTYYIGDVFGYMYENTLVLGQGCDIKWPYPFKTSVVKPYVPLQENLSIWWPQNENLVRDGTPSPNNIFHLDRPFLEVGMVIRRKGLKGFVKKKTQIATVKLMNDTTCIQNIPLESLIEITKAVTERQVLFKNYIGNIESVTHKVKMAFPNGNVCTIDYPKNNELYNGGAITPTFSDLKRASWCGGFNLASLRILQNLSCTAHVTDINVESLKINWNCPLPPAIEGQCPPSFLTGNELESVKYLPGDFKTPKLNTIWKLQITQTNQDNIFATEKVWLDSISGLTDGDDDQGVLKKQKFNMEGFEIGSVQTVKVLLIQTLIQIEFETGLMEKILSSDLDEILINNSLEIPRYEYVIRMDETKPLEFGLDLNYFEGETEQTPMNPKLNPLNMKTIQWFKVDQSNLGKIEPTELEEVSVYDLQNLKLNSVLKNCNYVTRVTNDDEFTVGSFSQILRSGLIEIEDLNENILQRWPTQLSVREKDNACEFLARICEIPQEPTANQFLRTHPCDFEQTTKVTVLKSVPFIRPVLDPVNPKEFTCAVHKILESLQDTFNPIFTRTWIQTYEDRNDLLSAFIVGQVGSIFEDILFLIEIQLPSNYPNKSPIFSLNLCPEFGRNLLSHLDNLVNVTFENWNEKTLLDGLKTIRDLIESTNISKMKHGTNWLPISYFYPSTEFTETEKKGWQQRWNEVIAIQSMRYVFNMIAHPRNFFQAQILGHYRYKLPILIARWKSWTHNEGLFKEVSPGFVSAVNNQLQRFDKFFLTSLIENLIVNP